MNSLSLFAYEISEYENWVLQGQDEGIEAVCTCAEVLAQIYARGLKLKASKTYPEALNVDLVETDCDHIRKQVSRIPFQHYAHIDEPMLVPPGSAMIKDIQDDLVEIFTGAVPVLRIFEEGRFSPAAQLWSYGFEHRWGVRVINAMGALYWYKRVNAKLMVPASVTPTPPQEGRTL